MKFLSSLCLILFGLAVPSAPDLQPPAATAVLYLQGKFHHVQGIDVEGKNLWISSVDSTAQKGYLSRVDLSTGRLEAQVEIQSGEYIHPGGISLSGNAIWVPLAEYRRNGKSTVQQRDKRSLSLLSQFAVNDHIGCLAVGRGWIAGGNWDSLQIYFWDHRGRLLRKVENPSGNRYQDMKWVDGTIIASGKLPVGVGSSGAIDWVAPDSLRLVRRMTTGVTDRGIALSNEGMTLRRDRLYLLPEDDPVRLFIFDMKKLQDVSPKQPGQK
jgi:hypothetical protein